MILAGDVGGTKVNLAYFVAEQGKPVQKTFRSYASRDFTSLAAVIDAFRTETPAPLNAAAFGIAGPVEDGRGRLTNLGWDVAADDLARHLMIPSVQVLNDLEATAYGALLLGGECLHVVQQGYPEERGPIAVIAAGTGLGEAGLLWDGRRYRAIPSEGGHGDFAPRNETEIDLLRFLLRTYEHVSRERLLSGPGIVGIYEFFRACTSRSEPAWLSERIRAGDPAAEISRAGLEAADETCARTVDLFASLYGAEAGNLALEFLATGGVYVGGGIGPKILRSRLRGIFASSFVDKGRMRPVLERMPVRLILEQHTALLGAAHAALLLDD